jgi:hypothetical protein
VLEKIEASDFDVLSARPILGATDKARILGRAAAWTAKRAII